MASSRAAIFINWLKMQLSGGKDANKIAKLILKHRYRISHKEVAKSKNQQGFSYYFLLNDGGIRISTSD
jgi:hypothetical protein